MSKDIDQAVKDAANNVACETGVVPNETMKEIKDQLMGMSKKSDTSFIYDLVKNVQDKEVSYGKHK